MNVLGIECTAHTLSIGICKNSTILSNVIDTYFSGKDGFIPRKLADHHSDVFFPTLKSSLEKASLTIEDIDLISFSQGPGIGAPLSVGVGLSKFLSNRFDIPLIGVNHPYAHVEISKLFCKEKDPLILYVSGGNTQILEHKKDKFFYKVIGETLDIGIGNMFDSFARSIKMEHAHGSALSKLAENGNYIDLPYSVKGLNLVYSGLQTAAEKAAKTHSHKDVAYSLMETAFAMTCEVTERALFLTNKKSLIACGGVAQNRTLQSMLKSLCSDSSIRFGVAPDEFNRDNGAMIAYAGFKLYKKFGEMKIENCSPNTTYRIDQIERYFTS